MFEQRELEFEKRKTLVPSGAYNSIHVPPPRWVEEPSKARHHHRSQQGISPHKVELYTKTHPIQMGIMLTLGKKLEFATPRSYKGDIELT